MSCNSSYRNRSDNQVLFNTSAADSADMRNNPVCFYNDLYDNGRRRLYEIHDDFFVFKQGRKSPRKVYWKEISGLAFSGNKHFLPFSVMNVFEETGNMEPQTIVLLDSTYEQYKKMWEDMILSYTKSQPESHNIDAKFGEFLNL